MGDKGGKIKHYGGGTNYGFINGHHVYVCTAGDGDTFGHKALIATEDDSEMKHYDLTTQEGIDEFNKDLETLQNGETPDLSSTEETNQNQDSNQRTRFNLWRALGLGRRERGDGVKARPDGRGDDMGDFQFPDLGDLPEIEIPGLGDDVPMPPGPSDEVKDWIVKGGTLPREIRRDLEELAKL